MKTVMVDFTLKIKRRDRLDRWQGMQGGVFKHKTAWAVQHVDFPGSKHTQYCRTCTNTCSCARVQLQDASANCTTHAHTFAFSHANAQEYNHKLVKTEHTHWPSYEAVHLLESVRQQCWSRVTNNSRSGCLDVQTITFIVLEACHMNTLFRGWVPVVYCSTVFLVW